MKIGDYKLFFFLAASVGKPKINLRGTKVLQKFVIFFRYLVKVDDLLYRSTALIPLFKKITVLYRLLAIVARRATIGNDGVKSIGSTARSDFTHWVMFFWHTRFSLQNQQCRFLKRNQHYGVQCSTQRVYSKRDLFKTFTSMSIERDDHNYIIHQFIEL